MKRTILTLALVLGTLAAAQPLFAQVGSSNGSGSGFLNSDIMVGRGGTPGPAELNLRLDGASYLSGYRLAPIGVSTVRGRILSQPAVISTAGAVMLGDACGTSNAVLIPQGCATVTRSVVIPQGDACAMPSACEVLTQPVVVAPAVCPMVCPPSDALIVPGTNAPTLIDVF